MASSWKLHTSKHCATLQERTRASRSAGSGGPKPAEVDVSVHDPDPPAQASSASSAPQASSKRTVLKREEGGAWIEARHLDRGTTVSEVYRVDGPGHKGRLLGDLKLMINQNTGQQTMQGRCKVHRSCICWLNSTMNSDLLLGWLSSGHTATHECHQALAKDLKRSLGMKVRG